jgi:NAD(P)-dependent dehydrogenase (short-subunit alcohol dehydrogenase family)
LPDFLGFHSLLQKRVAVTGAASGIGRETVRAFHKCGAIVAALDVNESGLDALVEEIGCRPLRCDVTNDSSVETAFQAIGEKLGGLDILVSNAGSALQGPIGDVAIEDLRTSFDLNFLGHQRVAQAALRLFREGGGGLMLFNISNQSVNPGKNFGPYGIPKAALLALMKQYALDHGHEGIRSNGVNAGRIRTGLLDEKTIEQRALARGLSSEAYMAGNLLEAEVKAADVAEIFVYLALMDKVNAAVVTVDGGAMATSLR